MMRNPAWLRNPASWISIGLCLAVLSSPVGAVPRTAAGPGAPPARGMRHEPGPPGPPSALLIEVSTGQVLDSADPHRRYAPASLDKLMTFYLALQAIKAHRVSLATDVTVSELAWRVGRTKGSSRMFLNVGDTVTIEQLLFGLMVASGNDAAEALGEALAGTGEQFVEQMNATAARLGMHDTHFVTAHGLPSPGEYSSVWDMGLLAREILLNFPEAVAYSSPREETYGGIRQLNWNNLIFRDSRVDGLKTGFTNESGYHIVASAHQGTLRLIAVVMGAHKLQQRTGIAERLLNQGFSRYMLVDVPWQRVVPSTVRVYGGIAATLGLETPRVIRVLIPRDDHAPLTISEEVTTAPIAPFKKGQSVGTLTIRNSSAVLATSPLVASSDIGRASLLARSWGMLRYRIGSLFRHRQAAWTGTYMPSQ
jgi:serine-type D-Ala-D-Ala carboxypeptidase (penicillin-binding protein 5/6)